MSKHPDDPFPEAESIKGCRRVVAANDRLGRAWSIVALSSILGFVGVLIAVPFVGIYLAYKAIFQRSIAAFLLLVLEVTSSFVPRGVDLSPWFAASRVWRLWRSYFGFTIVSEVDSLDDDRPAIWAEFPHGLFPVGPLLSQTLICELGSANTPFGRRPISAAVADSVTLLPFWRHVFGWLGASSATRANLERLIDSGKSVCIFPGGIAELFLENGEAEEHVFLKSRLGFIRLALSKGCDIIPSYHFGNSVVLRQCHSDFLTRVSRRLRFSLFLMIPAVFRFRIVQVVGRPIRVDKVDNPTDEQVNALHAKFVAELTRIFDEYKHLVGWQHRSLVVV